MNKRELYTKAAELIEQGRYVFACHALAKVLGVRQDLFYGSAEHKAFCDALNVPEKIRGCAFLSFNGEDRAFRVKVLRALASRNRPHIRKCATEAAERWSFRFR